MLHWLPSAVSLQSLLEQKVLVVPVSKDAADLLCLPVLTVKLLQHLMLPSHKLQCLFIYTGMYCKHRQASLYKGDDTWLFQESFLPTMPQDHLEEVREALLQGRHIRGGDANPVLYREC